MTLRWRGGEGPASRAVGLANEAARLAKGGRREESRRIFERAFGQVRAHKGTLGNRRNAAGER
ncbi:MAG TPA: hypothetical protein PKJ97_03680, partial [Candidatus Bilamarchaeaceae archaeon]|nr:hypothetical protein [Candidatus Bilamarchaeaceae archaeon]